MTDPIPHQQQSYDTLQGAKPCVFRGPLELKIKHVPATPCCVAKNLVESYKFFCTLYNTNITKCDQCWSCQNAKG